jgi:hypothetical protein
LPQIEPKLVADCKIQNPNFGQRVARPGEPGTQASPPLQEPPTQQRPPPEAIEPPGQSRPGMPPQAPPAPPTNDGGMEE